MGKKFKGIGCPCITPFNEEELLDLIALRELIDFQVNNEVNAIITTSSIGETYSLTMEEFEKIINTTIDQVNEAVPIYVGLPSDSLYRILTIAKYGLNAGVDGFVLYPPKIPLLSELELVNHIEFLSSKIEENILFVNDPDYCGINLSVELIRKISKFDNIIGMIELSSDFKKIAQISSEVRDDFLVFTGRGLLFPQALTEGGVEGAIVPSANIVPNLLAELYEAYKVEMKDRFNKIQTTLIPLEIGLKLRNFPATIKACLTLLGIPVGFPRKPLLPLIESDIDKLRNILISAGLLRPPSTEEESPEQPESDSSKNTK